MNHQEFIRLCGFSKARKMQFKNGWKGTTKRSAKKGRIQVLKHSRVVSETGTETIFNRPEYQRPLNTIRHPYVKKCNRKK
jgi:hypothetical protein